MAQYNFDAVQSFDINNSSYAGELALPYIAPAILAADTIANGYVTVHENVKFKAVMKKLSNNSAIVRSASCDFDTVGGELDLDEVVLQVTELMASEQLCKKDFRNDWEALQTGRGLINDRIPPNFETFLLQFLAAKVQEDIEKSIWGGNFDASDSSLSGGGEHATSFDGIFHHIVDAAASLGNDHQVAGAFTANADGTTGVLTHLDDVVNNAPSTLQNDSQAVIYMSRKTGFLLQRALGGFVDRVSVAGVAGSGESQSPTASAAQGLANSGILTGGFVGNYMGIPIIMPAGCPNDTILMANPGNLHFGCDLATDQIEAKVVDMSLTDASDNVRVAMRFSGGTQIGHAADISVARRTS